MFRTYLEKRKFRFEDSVRRVADYIAEDHRIRRFPIHDTFNLAEEACSPEMKNYFFAFVDLVIRKNVADFLGKRLRSYTPVGQEGNVALDMRLRDGAYDFRENNIVHESLHALVALMRSANKTTMSALTPEFQKKKPQAEDILTAIIQFPTPQVALQLRDEILITQFEPDRKVFENTAPAGGPGKTAPVRERILECVKSFMDDDTVFPFVAGMIASSPKTDPVFYSIMSEIVENNGSDPYLLYRIFVREAEEFLATFAPHVSKPVLPETV